MSSDTFLGVFETPCLYAVNHGCVCVRVCVCVYTQVPVAVLSDVLFCLASLQYTPPPAFTGKLLQELRVRGLSSPQPHTQGHTSHTNGTNAQGSGTQATAAPSQPDSTGSGTVGGTAEHATQPDSKAGAAATAHTVGSGDSFSMVTSQVWPIASAVLLSRPTACMVPDITACGPMSDHRYPAYQTLQHTTRSLTLVPQHTSQGATQPQHTSTLAEPDTAQQDQHGRYTSQRGTDSNTNTSASTSSRKAGVVALSDELLTGTDTGIDAGVDLSEVQIELDPPSSLGLESPGIVQDDSDSGSQGHELGRMGGVSQQAGTAGEEGAQGEGGTGDGLGGLGGVLEGHHLAQIAWSLAAIQPNVPQAWMDLYTQKVRAPCTSWYTCMYVSCTNALGPSAPRVARHVAHSYVSALTALTARKALLANVLLSLLSLCACALGPPEWCHIMVVVSTAHALLS